MTDIIDVIIWKFPGIAVSTTDGVLQFPPDIDGVNYGADSLPTQEDQDAWMLEYENYLMDTKYRRDRAPEYPEFKEQFDMIYHDKENGTDNWFETIKGIKEKFLKPS